MNYKVLIVDDSKLARMAAIRALRGCCPDWEYVEARNAADALSAMEHDAPQIALVDFNMPEQNGLQLVAELRKLDSGMPIAIISANNQQAILDRTAELHAAFLSKPLLETALDAFMKSAARNLADAAR